jgi:serine/threonine protein kinase
MKVPARSQAGADALSATAGTESSAAGQTALPSAGPEVPLALRDHPRYRVLGLLGQGGMGAVYSAEHRLMERPVALKLLNRELTSRPELVERFRREVKAAARLLHPHIVQALDAEQAGDTHFLVMELVAGTDLAHLVAERGPLPIGEGCEYIRQAALGLNCAHEQGMVHRDVKPHNLMRTPEGLIKVLDFGLARFVSEQPTDQPSGAQPGRTDRSQLTGVGMFMGTADYMAPEQASDPRKADIRADIYSLSCTLYHLLTGQVPFPGGSVTDKVVKHALAQPIALSQLRPDVPAALEAVVAKMMARSPDRRYQTPAEVAAALAPFAQAGTAEKTPRVPPEKRRSRWLLALAAALLVGLLGLVGVVISRLVTDKGKTAITPPSPDKESRLLDERVNKTVVTPPSPSTESRPPDERVNGKVRPPEEIRELWRDKGHTGRILGAVFSADGQRVLSSDSDGTVRWLDASTGELLRSMNRPSARGVANHPFTRGVAFSPDGKTAITPGDRDDRTMRLWDLETGEELKRFGPYAEDVHGMVFSADGQQVLFGLWMQKTMRLLEIETEKEIQRFDGHTDVVHGIALSPDGKKSLSGSRDKTVRLWDNETGKELKRLEGHKEQVLCAAFSPDGKRAVSGGFDREIRLWDLETGKEIRQMERHVEGTLAPTQRFVDLAFSSDGRRIASADLKTVRLWEAETGKELYVSERIKGPFLSVAFSPDGRFVVSTGYPSSVHVWRLPGPPATDRP